MPPKYNQETESDRKDHDYIARQALIRGLNDYIKHRCQDLNTEFWRYVTRTGKKAMALQNGASMWDVYLKWHEYNLEKRDKEDFSGLDEIEQQQKNNQFAPKIVPITASEPDVFKNFTALSKEQVNIDLKSHTRSVYLWPMRLSSKLNSKIKVMDQDKKQSIMEAILALQLGLMTDAQIIETGPIMYLAGFSKMIKGNMSLVFAIVPERVPVVKTILNKTHIVGFHFRQYLRVIDIVFQNDKKLAYNTYQAFTQHILSDPDKWNPFLPGNFLESTSGKQIAQGNTFEILDIKNIITVQPDSHSGLLMYHPNLQSSYKMSTIEAKGFEFTNMGRWVSFQEDSKFSYKIGSHQKNLNKYIIEKCTDEDSCAWLLEFLEKIPNFNLRLTAQEKRLITTPGNVLCIGRSGTGKTTSAVLRLFALEILFKIRSTLFFKEGESLKSASAFTADDAQSATGLHSVIVTASPVLTNEIRRFYQTLKEKVIGELRKREERKKQRLAQESKKAQENSSEDSAIQASDIQPSIDESSLAAATQAMEDPKLEDADDPLINEDEVLDFEEHEQQTKMAQSMADMRNEDFPAFLTIKRLVYMIDASVNRPFFARNIKNEIIGLDSQAEWHNEQKGVLMINNYYKMSGNTQPASGGDQDDIDRFMNLSSDDEGDGEDDDDEMYESQTGDKQVNRQIQGSKKKRQKFIEGEKVVQEYASEVDYELFERKFFTKYYYREFNRGIITPAIVWTEIFSIIKGSHNASDYPDKALPKDIYVNGGPSQSRKSSLLEEGERKMIYTIFQKYEQWKREIRGFDFMDLVNHILRELSGVYYKGTPIHFMLVDEVQDLTPATIRLLLKVTEQNIYFAGDTAQTIAKGVGFRFCDLKQMLNLTDFEAPKVLQLTVNFRSHNRILNLANSIISAVEIFFPQTIDKLIKERSDLDGLKPIVLDSSLLDNLFYVLLGQTKQGSSEQQQYKASPAEFGCDQVIIVRDQESKKKVPSVLQHALCLTVYECKGLEFEDVILYNFFTDAPDAVAEQWKLINSLQVEKVAKKTSASKTEEEGNVMQDLDDLNFESQQEQPPSVQTNIVNEHTTGEYEDQITLASSGKQGFYKAQHNFYKDYSALCTDLKQLYVCITRPKKRLIIYDEDRERREIATNYWLRLDAVQVVNEEMLKQSSEGSEISEEQRLLMEKLKEGQSEKKDNEANKKGWRAQGIKMFKRRYYEQAMKCFDHSGDELLKKRAHAYSLAEDASKTQSEADSVQYRLDDQFKNLDKQQRRNLKEEIFALQQKSLDLFKQASTVFLSIDLKKQAAQCLFTAQQYREAAFIFEQIGFYSQAGEAYFTLEDYSRAAMLFSEGGVVSRAVDCYKLLRNWDAILQCVKTNEQEFTQEQREALIKKYVPLALNSLYTLITQDHEIGKEDSDEGESQVKVNPHQQIVNDYDVMTQKSVIKEESSEEDEDENNEDQQQSALKQSAIEEKSSDEESEILTDQSQIQISEVIVQVQVEKKDLDGDFVMIDASGEDQKSKKVGASSESEFSIISSQQDMSQEQQAEQFEHLSQFDPEDEFLKSRTVSVIESVMSGDYKSRAGKSELSDYSIIDQESNPDSVLYTNEVLKGLIQQNVNLIKTRRDIYAEDILMTKIIYYVSQFSSDVRFSLNKLRSKDALLSNKPIKKPQVETIVSEFEEINTCSNKDQEQNIFMGDLDLDQIEPEFLNILLDCLESFELYKLCLIVCNRYQLTDRVGRYLVSIANKYSNLPQIATQFVHMFHPQHHEVQAQVSFIAHQAMHSALELIEPRYLKIKEGKMDETNSLGQYCFTGLLNHGFWKKLLYLTDVQSSLSIALMFGDFRSFRQVYLAFTDNGMKLSKKLSQEQIIKAINEDSFTFLQDAADFITPSNQTDSIAFIAALDSIIWSFSKEDVKQDLKDLNLPMCFKLTEKALKVTHKFSGLSMELKQSLLSELIRDIDQRIHKISLIHRVSSKDSNDFLENNYLYDTSVALFLLIANAFKGTMTAQIHVLQGLPQDLFQVYLRSLNKFIALTFGNNKKSDFLAPQTIKTLLSGMFTVLRVRFQVQCEALFDNYGDKLIINSKSALAQSLTEEVEERKKKLADQITQQVFAEMDNRWNTRAEINKEIKKRLKSEIQKMALNSMIEIIDLEANFIRAPFSLIIEKINKQIQNYIKVTTERQIKFQGEKQIRDQLKKTEVQCFTKKEEIDNIQSPFELNEKLQAIIKMHNSSIQVQKFFGVKKSLRRYLVKEKAQRALNQDSIQYHLQKEKEERLQKQLKAKQYMVKVGLATQKEVDSFKKQLNDRKNSKNVIHKQLNDQLKNISALSFLTFDPLPKEIIDMSTHQNLLEIAYHYWELYVSTITKSDEGAGMIEYAAMSMSIYVALDHYIYFMQIIQQQLPQKSEARKLLFQLIDAHIYKKYGNLLESSASFISFVKCQQEFQESMDYYYLTNMVEIALVHLLSTREKREFYLTFEQVHHLSHLLWFTDDDQRSDFETQVQNYFSHEDDYDVEQTLDPVTLKLRNSKYFMQTNQEDKRRYQSLLLEILQLMEHFVKTYTITKLLHVFFSILTILVNEPEFCDQNSTLVWNIINKLIDEGLFEDDAYIITFKTYQEMAKNFFESDYVSQNSVLYLERRGQQQSIWVKVQLIDALPSIEIKKNIEQGLKESERIEAEQLQKMQKCAELFKQVYQRKKKVLISKLKGQDELPMSDRLLLESLQTRPNFDAREEKKNLGLLRKISDLSKFIRVVILNAKLDNVIDLHYLLNQVHKIETEFIPKLIQPPQEVSSLDDQIQNHAINIEEEISGMMQQVQIWSENKSNQNERGSQLRNQRIMKLKWREQAMKVRQKLLAKVAAKKKDDAYKKKRMRIKGRI